MTTNPLGLTIRAKKLGALIKDARKATFKSVSDCAQSIGVSNESFEAYEMGDQAPSLPELELLAFFLNVPLDHFWSDQTYTGEESFHRHADPLAIQGARQSVIATTIQELRADLDLSEEELAQKANILIDRLQSYERGDDPIPLPELETLARALGVQLSEFQDQQGPVGLWSKQQKLKGEFQELSEELQAFVCKPVNRPYIELAQRLSEMSVEKLRAVAEGLLEITL